MENAIFWIIAFILSGVTAWMVFRPKGGASNFDEVKKAVKAGAQIVDVRTPAEFAGGHADGARNIPVEELQGKLDAVGPKDKAVVVYCRSGNRSARAAKILQAAGFTSVVDGHTVEFVRSAASAA